MNFVAALTCGTTPEVVASRCVNQLLLRSEPQGELSLEAAADFINELFKAIGLHTQITPQQCETGKDFDWDAAGCRRYIFHRNSIFFNSFELFLNKLSKAVRNIQATAAESKALVLYLQLLGVWCNCCMDLQKQDSDMQVKFLVEPIARINYQLFLGVHQIKKNCDVDFGGLNLICRYLLNSALHGLYFEECHSYIAEGLSKIIEQYFGASSAFNEDAFQFYRLVFRLGHHKATHCGVFKSLIRMLDKLFRQQSVSNHRQLVSFLIEKGMQEVYYTFLKLERTKGLLKATLTFLEKLRPHLLDLECLSQTFLEAILRLALHKDESISLTAAQLYIKFARAKTCTDEYILKHILEFYLEDQANLESLMPYVNALWSYFPYMQSIEIYFKLLKDAGSEPDTMHYFVAQFIIVVYKKMLKYDDCERYANAFIFVYKTLPALFKESNSECVNGILLQIYSLSDQKMLCEHNAELKQFLPNLEDYFVSIFKGARKVHYLYLYASFVHFAHSIAKTKNFYKLDGCGLHVYGQYVAIERALKDLGAEKSPSAQQVDDYCYTLQKIGVLLKVGYNVFDQLEHIMKTLNVRLLQTKQIHKFVDKERFIDVYAIDLLVSGCITLSHNKEFTRSSKMWLVREILALENYLVKFLSKAESTTNAQMYRVKTHFVCLTNLYYSFREVTDIPKLPLRLHPYHVLVETLLSSCLQRKPKVQVTSEEESEFHPKHIISYQRNMFNNFTLLHSTKDIELPSPVAWKLCMRYGATTHKFADELFAFMQALIKHHSKIFAHISAVLIYNLYNQRPPFTIDVIQSVISAQKSFIDRLPAEHTPTLLCVTVVLRVLQFLQQALLKIPPITGGNRLMALKHLYLYTENLNVSDDNVLPDIRNQAKALQNHILNNAEQMSLKAYLCSLGVNTETNGGI
ncbi:uncharacterized protein LOC105232079 [Bactrocera dorsalis]|uniref:Uncharacterized protein LOC105232079 n=1 Tax=Bactrocera dorsalis TaxID=27457 RepID=A0A6I9VFM9_BACDO|nr:uncharacterized protein LOC105232079 [Bactrocera dorsalis]